MRILNLGILAHVDAGKTSLTERLLFRAGVIDRLGSVDAGSTQTDSLPLERQRGITIKAAAVSFAVEDVIINLIDTPGHPDFIAEVERVLHVLDGAVLVISAVQGVQAQSRVLMRTLKRLGIPTLLFVNKLDRGGARPEHVLAEIGARLTPTIIAMGAAREAGTRTAAFLPYPVDDPGFANPLAELLAGNDDALLAAYLDGGAPPAGDRLRAALAAQSRQGLVHPVYFGSAITGAGVDALTAGITTLLPAAAGDGDAPLAASVFKIERGPAGEKIASVRVFAGALHPRDRLRIRDGAEQKVTAIRVFDRGAAVPCAALVAGRIGRVWGLNDVQIGDTLGTARAAAVQHVFAPPALEAVIEPCHPAERGALRVALDQLAEQDPLIQLRQESTRGELSVSLYGEVQKEVIQATLATEYGIEVRFRETVTVCIERPAATGAAVELIRGPVNPFLATVGLRVEPAATGSGVQFRPAGEVLGTMPAAFFQAVADTVQAALRQGLYGWQVTDCTVTLTHTGYYPRQSHAHQGFDKSMSSTGADFRGLTPLVLMAALAEAGTVVYEPVQRFRIEAPADTLGPLLRALAALEAMPQTQTLRGAVSLLEGVIPAAHVHDLQRQLPALTRGEGVVECLWEGYQPVRGVIPTRPRGDASPLNRKEYLLQLTRRTERGGRAV